MIRMGFAAVLVLPVVIMGCNRTPEPEPQPVMAPMMSGPEQVCADRAAAIAGTGPEAVTVVPTASTKTGAGVYTASVARADYSCVVEPDMTVSAFEPVMGGLAPL